MSTDNNNKPTPKDNGITEGVIIKGGLNPSKSQIITRPPPPKPVEKDK